MSKCRIRTKNHYIYEKEKFRSNKKLDIERIMNEFGKPFRKKFDPENRKNSKNQSEQKNH